MSVDFTLIERITIILDADFNDVEEALGLVSPQTLTEIIDVTNRYAKIKVKGIQIEKSGADINYKRDRENIRDWLSRALKFGSTSTGLIVATAGSASIMKRLSCPNPTNFPEPPYVQVTPES